MFLNPAKIRGGLGEIFAVRYRVRPRSHIMWYNFYDALLGSLGIRGGVFKVYAKKIEKRTAANT